MMNLKTTQPVHSRRIATVRPWLAAGVSIFVVACGNVTAGGIGTANLLVSGDALTAFPTQMATSVRGAESPGDASPETPFRFAKSEHDRPEGEIEVEFLPFLIAEDSTLVQLTDGEVRVRVDVEGAREWEAASRAVTARRYVGLRIVFVEIEAEIDAGLIINGEPVTGAIDVEIETILTVDKSVAVEIADAQVVDLVMDLNAADWLQAVDPTTSSVSPEVFANLINVFVRDLN